jgi:hypothetical protein
LPADKSGQPSGVVVYLLQRPAFEQPHDQGRREGIARPDCVGLSIWQFDDPERVKKMICLDRDVQARPR